MTTARDALVAIALLVIVVFTHLHEHLGFDLHRDAQRYFYAMQGWSGVVLSLALLYFLRATSPAVQATLYVAAIWNGVQQGLVGACGTALLLSGRPYQERGVLCDQVEGWYWIVVGLCGLLWWLTRGR